MPSALARPALARKGDAPSASGRFNVILSPIAFQRFVASIKAADCGTAEALALHSHPGEMSGQRLTQYLFADVGPCDHLPSFTVELLKPSPEYFADTIRDVEMNSTLDTSDQSPCGWQGDDTH